MKRKISAISLNPDSVIKTIIKLDSETKEKFMVNRYDIITFGSATWDIYISPSQINVISSNDFISGKP